MKATSYSCSAQTKQKLIQAVIRLAHSKSYATITVQEICAEAGVSTGSFYHQFGSKEGLVREAYRSIDWLLTDEFVAQYSQLPPQEALDCLLRRYLGYVRREIGLTIGQYYQGLLASPGISRYDLSRPYCREIRRLLILAAEQRQISVRYDPDALTYACMRILRGLLMDWVIQGGVYDLESQYQTEFEVFMRGLAPERGGV